MVPSFRFGCWVSYISHWRKSLQKDEQKVTENNIGVVHNNHYLCMLTPLMMKRFVLLFAALGLLFACTLEESNNGNDGAAHVNGISLDRPTATIKEGESITLVATVTPSNANNKNVTWTTSSEAVATVDNNGKVTGVKAGSATITATTEDGGKQATCSLSVETNLAPSVTVEANHVSAISAVLTGKANLGSTVASDLKVGNYIRVVQWKHVNI